MPKELVIRGLPASLAQDSWWLASEAVPSEGHARPARPKGSGLVADSWLPRPVAMLLLVLLGDQLLWVYKPGLSLGVFAWCIFAVVIFRAPSSQRKMAASAILLLGTLPILEHVQLLSLAILTAGLVTAIALLRLPHTVKAKDMGPWLAASILRIIETLPTAGMGEMSSRFRDWRNHVKALDSSNHFIKSLARNWAFPLGGVLVLSALLISANPVLEHALMRVFQVDIDVFSLVQRIVFWTGLALLIWPLLMVTAPEAPAKMKAPGWNTSRLLNAGSVFRALILFNLMLAVQSLMDASILLGGAELPEGMSHATYAHRGAYPLLATALLAGAFALAARPFLKQNPSLKPLLLMWLAQNVLLTLSAAFRLHLYIEAFGLTYLRVYALIWMGLVAAGLVMVAWQVMRNNSSYWLLLRVTALGVGTLYLCAFVNFAALIATDTLSRAADPRTQANTDWVYLCSLGHSAAKAIVEQMKRQPINSVPSWAYDCVHPTPTEPAWRVWDFRTARVNGYLASNTQSEAQ